MEKKFFDWADDPELNGKSKVVDMPLTGDKKAEQEFQDLLDGYEYGRTGMLQKEITLPGKQVIEYNPNEVGIDEKGRRYFFGDDGYRHDLTEDNRLYDVRVSEDGVEEEYTVFRGGRVFVFKNPEHTIGITDDGMVYRYEAETNSYVYDPQLVIFPNQHR